MTTRGLKILTGSLIAAGVLVIVTWPFAVGVPQKGASRSELRAYVTRGLVATSALIVIVTGAGIGAFLLIRRAREEYREQSMSNMRSLLEQTREDQLKKAQAARDQTEE